MKSWTIGVLLGMATILVHAAAMASLAVAARRVRYALDVRRDDIHAHLRKVTAIIALICIALGLLHTLEAAAWAAPFVRLDAIGSFGDALFYSIDTMATRGASGLALIGNWRMLGAIESSCGVLLFGMSTAFIFAVIQADFGAITEALHRDRRRGQRLHPVSRATTCNTTGTGPCASPTSANTRFRSPATPIRRCRPAA
ncbi:two pore domain potassium channel family protein [Burkholderia ubonensis]|uniref:two pore domain potassium channel family protein n=1 Tax=Burkholderia ubonensis TaxID=101571 RepID=UPI001E518DE2|nr:two pore domain potassium channel family protein [Burkholderia ubonensis]